MQKHEFGDKIMLNITALTDFPSMQGDPAGIIGPTVFELLEKHPYPFTLDRAGRRKNETADAAHVNLPTSYGL